MPPINSPQNQPTAPRMAPALDNALLRRIVEASPDCIETFDAEGKLQWMNSGGQGALGIAEFTELEGAEWASLWAEDTREQARQATADIAGSEGIAFRGQRPTAAGNLRWWGRFRFPAFRQRRRVYRRFRRFPRHHRRIAKGRSGGDSGGSGD